MCLPLSAAVVRLGRAQRGQEPGHRCHPPLSYRVMRAPLPMQQPDPTHLNPSLLGLHHEREAAHVSAAGFWSLTPRCCIARATRSARRNPRASAAPHSSSIASVRREHSNTRCGAKIIPATAPCEFASHRCSCATRASTTWSRTSPLLPSSSILSGDGRAASDATA